MVVGCASIWTTFPADWDFDLHVNRNCAAQQAATFSNSSLKGTYSFLNSLQTANVGTNQFAMVGVLAFDGAGDVTGSYTSISWDKVRTGTLGGTYTVKSNGTGTMTITFTPGSTAQFEITLNSTAATVAHGLQLLQINDTNNEIISGTAMLQETTFATYSVASLQGKFALQYNPRTADGTLAEDGGVGIFTFDGKGNLTASMTIMYDGQLFTKRAPITGTYSVNSDGSGRLSVGSKHKPQLAFALNSVAAGLANGLQFLDTHTGDGSGNLVITGSALKQ